MAAVEKSIGASGCDYSTIAAWEDYCDGDPNNQNTGICEAEAFAKFAFYGGTYTETNYPHLTVKAGAQHNGRAHEVSGKGNARIESAAEDQVVLINDEFARVSWLEIKGPGANNKYILSIANVAACTSHIHHCIVHNNAAGGADCSAIYASDPDLTARIYRNITYGAANVGIYLSGAADSAVLCNTSFANKDGLTCTQAAAAITGNACFANTTKDFPNTTGVQDYNASSDATAAAEGANSIANLTTANQFVNPTTTWAETDLRVKAGAGIIGEGVDLTSASYPEIEYPISSRTVAITGAWDIGADQYVASFLPAWFTAINRRR